MPDEDQCGIKEDDWDTIIKRIRSGKCVPFIGPGFCGSYYPSKATIADRWALSLGYPFEDRTNLARVAHFLEVKEEDVRIARERMIDELRSSTSSLPDFADSYEPHRVLAELPFPVYITTNYDDYMFKALSSQNRDPRRDFPQWRFEPKEGQRRKQKFTAANPLVFHLYGHTVEIESLVLSERDYMRFLLKVVRSQDVIPQELRAYIMGKSLLLLGYQLDDWDTRVLLTVLDTLFSSVGLTDSKHVSVQLAPLDEKRTPQQRQTAQEHFNHYLKSTFNVSVYWGTCEQFAKGLRDRWHDYKE